MTKTKALIKSIKGCDVFAGAHKPHETRVANKFWIALAPVLAFIFIQASLIAAVCDDGRNIQSSLEPDKFEVVGAPVELEADGNGNVTKGDAIKVSVAVSSSLREKNAKAVRFFFKKNSTANIVFRADKVANPQQDPNLLSSATRFVVLERDDTVCNIIEGGEAKPNTATPDIINDAFVNTAPFMLHLAGDNEYLIGLRGQFKADVIYQLVFYTQKDKGEAPAAVTYEAFVNASGQVTETPPTPIPTETTSEETPTLTPDPTETITETEPTPTATPTLSPSPTGEETPIPTPNEYKDNAPPEFNLTIESEQSCGCGNDSPHFGGIAIASAECPGCLESADIVLQDSGSVYLHNGELFLNEKDLEIPGRGFNWSFERKYRSGITFHGPLGHNWDFNYNRRLSIENNGDALRMDGYGRVDRYEAVKGRFFFSKKSFKAPAGFYTGLTENSNGAFTERDRNGVTVEYSKPDGMGIAMMTELRDRNNNVMRFEYNNQGRLSRVIDTLGRPIDYIYDGQRRLIEVRDFVNRSIKLEYDENNDLVSVTSPAVTGMPNGNNFPNGKTTRFTYSTGSSDKTLRHNLLTITAPNEVASGGEARALIEYETNSDSPNKDRVISQTMGGANAPAEFAGNKISFDNDAAVPAGGTITYEYESLGGAADDDFTSPVAQTIVIDRNGNETEYRFNQLGNIVRTRELTNRDIRTSDPDFFETQYEYNRDGEMLRMIKPEGNSIEISYDTANTARFQQGNILRDTYIPDKKRGGDQEKIITSYKYEPIYNQPLTKTEARGNDPDFVPQNNGTANAERYTTSYTFDYQEGRDFAGLAKKLGISKSKTRKLLKNAGVRMGLGDVNGDGRTDRIAGNVIREVSPSVNLLPESNMVGIEGDAKQGISNLIIYNDFGRPIKAVDPEGNVTVYNYFPENDPDGDGKDITDGVGDGPFGYNKEVVRDAESNPNRNSGADPEPANISMRRFYDRAGNVIKTIDGRGIATEYIVNQLNQITRAIKASSVSEAAANLEEPKGNDDETGLVAFKYIENIFYDFNNNIILRQIEDRGNTGNVGGNNEDSGTAFVDYITRYDILDQPIESALEVSDSEDIVTRHRYDPNENKVLTIEPEGNAVSYGLDERDLIFQTTRGAVSPPEKALLSANDPTNYDVRGGTPSTTTYHYDLNGNIIEAVDAADTDGSAANNSSLGGPGDRSRIIYDGFDRQTSVVDSVGNQSITQYDPAGNVTRASGFGPVGGASPSSDGPKDLAMPVSSLGVIQAENLANTNLMQATETLYDELNRPFQTDQVLFVNTIPLVREADVTESEPAGPKKSLEPIENRKIAGLPDVEIIGRVSSRTEYDRNSRATFTIEDDGDTSRAFYDGVNRVIKTMDPEGNTVETAYDDNNNVIETLEIDVAQVKDVADEKFLTTMFYDSLNRLHRRIDNIGQTISYRYDSRGNKVATADANGPVTGAVVKRRAFDAGLLTVNAINDFGNVSIYSYDGINRKTESNAILTATGKGDGTNIGVDLFGIRKTTPTPDTTQSGDGLITVKHDWDKNSLLTALIDDNGNRTIYTFDNLNRRLTETKGISVEPKLAGRDDPDTTITREYDADDNVVRITDENGSVVNCRFDALNRQVERNITRASKATGTTAESYEYDGLSRLTKATDNNEPAATSDDSVTTFAWDSLGRIIEEAQQIGALPQKAISSAWRSENLKTACVYPNDRVVASAYDQLDRLNTIGDLGALGGLQPIAQYNYIGKWRVAERTYPINGARMTFLDDTGKSDAGYDGLRRTTQLRHLKDGNTQIAGFTHNYDRMSNKLTEEKLHDTANSELYGYDSVYRVIDFQRGQLNAGKSEMSSHTTIPGFIQRQQWALDGVGNWASNTITRAGATPTNEERQTTSFNEYSLIGGVANEHDDNGNLTNDGNLKFEWDYKNRLRRVSQKSDNALVAVYSYHADGRRCRKAVVNSDADDTVTYFYYDSLRVVEERDSADSLTHQYVYGAYIDEPLTIDRNLDNDATATGPADSRLFYHQNTLYSTFALTDKKGAVVEGYEYDAYGKQTVFTPPNKNGDVFRDESIAAVGGMSNVNNPYLYTGRRADEETGLYYYRQRYVDADTGRFLQREPLGYSVGMNLYQYVYGRPTKMLDPTGLKAWCTGIQGNSGALLLQASFAGKICWDDCGNLAIASTVVYAPHLSNPKKGIKGGAPFALSSNIGVGLGLSMEYAPNLLKETCVDDMGGIFIEFHVSAGEGITGELGVEGYGDTVVVQAGLGIGASVFPINATLVRTKTFMSKCANKPCPCKHGWFDWVCESPVTTIIAGPTGPSQLYLARASANCMISLMPKFIKWLKTL